MRPIMKRVEITYPSGKEVVSATSISTIGDNVRLRLWNGAVHFFSNVTRIEVIYP